MYRGTITDAQKKGPSDVLVAVTAAASSADSVLKLEHFVKTSVNVL